MGTAVDHLIALSNPALQLAHVKAHTKTVHGHVVHVKAYDTKTAKKAPGAKLLKVHLLRNDRPPKHLKNPNIFQGTDPDDSERLRNYVDYGDNYNYRLRHGFAGDDAATLKEFDAVLAKGTVTHDFITYRSMVSGDWLPKDLAPGTILTDKGYTSTTPYGATASNWVAPGGVSFAIEVPKGAHAIYVPDVMGEDQYGEGEVLLPRGSKFEVISDDPKGMYVQSLWGDHQPPPMRLIHVKLVP